MITDFSEMQRLSKDGLNRALDSFGAVTKGLSALAIEMTDASRKAFAANSSYVERLLGARTLDRAVEVQTDFARAAYEGVVVEAGRVNGMMVDIAKEAVRPFEIVKTA